MAKEVLSSRGRIDLFFTDLILRHVLRKLNRERPNSGMPEYTRGLKDIFLDLVRKSDSSPDTECTILSLKPKASVIEKTMIEGIDTSLESNKYSTK